MKHILILLSLVVTALNVNAAGYSVQSKLLDKRNSGPIEMATVRLLNAADSTLVTGVVTDQYGSFSLKDIPSGNYIMECKYLGYKDFYQNVTVKDKPLVLKNIYMEESAQELGDVQVTGMAAQMIVKVDTVEYNAAAYQTHEGAVVEDLLKKLPGVQVNNGTITVNGETISRIKVDGKKFFDGDNEMVTKNLTADMVEKIQVIDERSDMAKLTGFEDDETERIINITLKANRRKGIFGNIGAGVGADLDQNYFSKDYDWSQFLDEDFRYSGNAFVNFMLGNSQTALIAGANNANNSLSGRGRGMMMGGWGNGGGITSTQNFGLNNNSQIGDNILLGGDVSFNHSRNYSETETSRDSWLAGDTLRNKNYNNSVSNSNFTNVRLEMEWKIDSLNTLIIQPSINFNHTTGDQRQDYDYYTNGDSTSWGSTLTGSTSDQNSSRLNLIYSHKSAKRAGRTITLNVGGNYSKNTSESTNESFKNSRIETGDSLTHIRQLTKNTGDNYSANLRFSYVEPLWNLKNFIELSASFNFSNRYSEKMQYDLLLDRLDDEYSNNYQNRSISEIAEVNYRYNDGTLNLMAGIKVQPTQNYSYTEYLDGSDPYKVNQNVVNFSPTLSVRYNMGDRRNFLRAEYRGNSQQPTITQMQPVKNNSDLMNETVGNASLVPAYQQNLRLIFTKNNAETLSSMNLTLFGNLTQNALVSNSIYDKTGKQYNQTVNADRNPFNLNFSFMYNTPVVANRLHLNTRTSANYGERVGYTMRSDEFIDPQNMPLGDLSRTESVGVNEDLSLTFTHDVIEIGARGNFSYNHTYNALSGSIQNTLNWSGSGNINIHLPYSWNIATDITYGDRSGYADFDQKEILWNASIDKTFNQKLTVSLSITDILRQRLNINQTIGDNYISYNKYNTLPSYFLLTVTYKIASFGGGASQDDMFGGGRRGRGGNGPMGGGMPPMGGGFVPPMGGGMPMGGRM